MYDAREEFGVLKKRVRVAQGEVPRVNHWITEIDTEFETEIDSAALLAMLF